MSVRVRVVPVVDERRAGWIAGVLGGALAFAYAGLGYGHRVPASLSKGLFGVILSMWIGGTLLSWRPRPYVARAIVEGRALRLGSRALAIDDQLAVHVARGARGFSVVVSRGNEGAFLEVESEADARQLLAELGVPWPGRGEVVLAVPHRGVRFAQRLSAVAGVTFALLYSLFVGVLDAPEVKAVFGLPALFLGIGASLLYVFEPLLRAKLPVGMGAAQSFGRGLADAHARLHDLSPVRGDERTEPPAPARIRVLEPAGEPPRAWLDRIDAIGKGEGGYRGDAPGAEELEAILEDAAAPAPARLASARLLALRHGKPAEELRARIADEALAVRVRVIVLPDPAAAAEELEQEPPLFALERLAP